MMMTLAQRGMVVPHFDLAVQKEHHHDITSELFWDFAARVQPYTELSIAALFNLYTSVRYVVEAKIPGDIVECGVHMGGSVMMIALALMESNDSSRDVFALDTFTGFVRRTEDLDVDLRTGAVACEPEENAMDYTGPSTENMKSVGYNNLHIVKGDVFDTIPELKTPQIAILRLDTDTYDTTKFELEQLYDRVAVGGVIIVDDYGYTVGCKKAVDDFIVGRSVMLQRINPNVRSWVKTAR